jgi:hypothetical protein
VERFSTPVLPFGIGHLPVNGTAPKAFGIRRLLYLLSNELPTLIRKSPAFYYELPTLIPKPPAFYVLLGRRGGTNLAVPASLCALQGLHQCFGGVAFFVAFQKKFFADYTVGSDDEGAGIRNSAGASRGFLVADAVGVDRLAADIGKQRVGD